MSAVKVGAPYCVLHDGLLNEDDDRCDFADNDIETGDTLDTGEPRPCDTRQLYYLEGGDQ